MTAVDGVDDAGAAAGAASPGRTGPQPASVAAEASVQASRAKRKIRPRGQMILSALARSESVITPAQSAAKQAQLSALRMQSAPG